jgi:peptidoglycan/xylan/chitin deacetylase (PgdA/CDA1 family)
MVPGATTGRAAAGPPVRAPAVTETATSRVLDLRGPVLDRTDRVGLALMAASAVWPLVVAVVAEGSPWAMAGLFGLTASAFVLGRLSAMVTPVLAPGAVVALAAALLLTGPLDTIGSIQSSGILGYPNARSAFFIQAAVAALMVAVRARGRGRALAAAAALAFAAVPFANRSTGAVLSAAVLAPAAVAAFLGRGSRIVMGACIAAVAVAVVVTTVLAITYSPEADIPVVSRAVDALPERRVELWQDALSILREHPLTGVGPGRFVVASPLARTDADARWAHNGFLQVGAETGLVGLALLALLFAWGLVRLWSSPGDPRLALLGMVAIAALGVHATVDYILHFPIIPVTTAALVGTATARRMRARSGVSVGTVLRKASKASVLPLGLMRRRRPGDLSILVYHRVGVGEREIDLPLADFERQMAYLSERERVLTLDQALEDDGGGVVVTIDDGFRDFHEHVVPVLERHGVPAILYLATGLVEDGSADDRLTWSNLEDAVATGLVTVGSHTHSHAELSKASEALAEEEMRRSRDLIEDRLGSACRHFAYPWAVGSPEADRAARRLFQTAALGAWRTNRRGRIDRYRLGRTPILRSDGHAFFRAKVAGLLDAEAFVYRALRRGPWRVP